MTNILLARWFSALTAPGLIMTDDELQTLSEKINGLCARCEYLYRENRQLQRENQQLRNRCEKAKQALRELLAVLPEYE